MLPLVPGVSCVHERDVGSTVTCVTTETLTVMLKSSVSVAASIFGDAIKAIAISTVKNKLPLIKRFMFLSPLYTHFLRSIAFYIAIPSLYGNSVLRHIYSYMVDS